MPVEITRPGETVTVQSRRGAVVARSPSCVVGVATGVLVGGGGIPYEGSYEADARFTEQVFPTKQKSMRDDFTVHAINYTEARNDSGITVTIGG